MALSWKTQPASERRGLSLYLVSSSRVLIDFAACLSHPRLFGSFTIGFRQKSCCTRPRRSGEAALSTGQLSHSAEAEPTESAPMLFGNPAHLT